MSNLLNVFLWQQFGAAVDMLANAIAACPDELWKEEPRFCQLGHHTAFFLDYYLSDATPRESDYAPPPPFTKSEFEDVPPAVRYSKAELLGFLRHAREKLRGQLTGNSAGELQEKRFVSEDRVFSLFELLLYNMRHVQHHTAQLNMLLRQRGVVPPDWVGRTKEGLSV